jgi:hypothetical protein
MSGSESKTKKGDITTRFLCVYRPSKQEGAPPTQQEMAEMGKLIEEGMKSGVLLATEGCLPSAKGARVRLSGGKFTVTDGPFTESKELVAGFALIQVKSTEEAIEHTKQFLKVAGDGESEIRQVFEASDFSPETYSPEISARTSRARAAAEKAHLPVAWVPPLRFS